MVYCRVLPYNVCQQLEEHKKTRQDVYIYIYICVCVCVCVCMCVCVVFGLMIVGLLLT